jgi:mandelate racemase
VITKAPLILIDLETEEGVTGRSYLWCYFPAAIPAIAKILEEVARVVQGERLAPAELWSKLAERFALIGVQGIVRMAMAGFDVAAWDALAIAAGWPLATLIGSKPKRIPAYNSCGLGLMAPQRVADEAEKLLAGGFRAVKLRLGYPTLEDDLAALHAVKKRLGSEIAVMVDYNQALSLAQALERGRALDQEGIYWLEEPIRHDDYAGNATLARELKTPIQIGENFSESAAMAAALAAGAADYVMPDLERIGGVTGWLRAAALAATHRVEMSSHLFPEVSAHLLAATPTAHFLEYVDWADKILAEPLEIVDGFAVVPQRPGNGLIWDAKAVEKYRIA